MQKDFVTVTPDSGSGNKTITVQAAENIGGARSTSLKASGGSIEKTIAVSQKAGIRKLNYQAIVNIQTARSGGFGVVMGVRGEGASTTIQSPRLTVPFPASLGRDYATEHIYYDSPATGGIRCQMVFAGMTAERVNYVDFQVFGLNTEDPDWDSKETGRVLPQTEPIWQYLQPTTFTNEGDHFNSRYICPEGTLEAVGTFVFVVQTDRKDYIEGAIPAVDSDTGLIITAVFSM